MAADNATELWIVSSVIVYAFPRSFLRCIIVPYNHQIGSSGRFVQLYMPHSQHVYSPTYGVVDSSSVNRIRYLLGLVHNSNRFQIGLIGVVHRRDHHAEYRRLLFDVHTACWKSESLLCGEWWDKDINETWARRHECFIASKIQDCLPLVLDLWVWRLGVLFIVIIASHNTLYSHNEYESSLGDKYRKCEMWARIARTAQASKGSSHYNKNNPMP